MLQNLFKISGTSRKLKRHGPLIERAI